jgi:hypothetical protein
MTNPSDVDFATIKIEKPGTAVVQGKFSGDMDLGKWDPSLAGIVNHSASHVKTFLNLTNDGMATKRLGGNDVLEVVFAEEVPDSGLRAGNEVKFKFYLKGAPYKNEGVFATYIGAPVYTDEIGDEVNDYLTATTDENGIAAFTPDRAEGWFVGAMIEGDELVEKYGKEYGGGIMFAVSERGNEGGGSGCDSGVGVLWFSAAALAGAKIRKKRT